VEAKRVGSVVEPKVTSHHTNVAKFAFVIHPLNARDVARRYPIAKYLPERAVEAMLRLKHPMVVSQITGLRSKTGAEAEGCFIGCPLTPAQMMGRVPLEAVYRRIDECAELAAAEGAELIGLGAFTSVVGDGGITIADRATIGVTTGNSYTVATAIQGTLRACNLLDMDTPNSTLAVVGATGSIGKTCARVLARNFGRVILIGRDLERTQVLADELSNATATTDFALIKQADAVITVTSTESAVILPEHLKPGAVVCDVARPRDVSVRVAEHRKDVLVIEGGVVRVPGNVDFGFDFGFPGQTAYACMSETMMLALEGDPSLYNFTVGKDVSVEQVDVISALADKHGFELAGFRSFEHPVDDVAITRARNARTISTAIPRTT
jgi:fatty aldehyde-generating acyl-ACP reductase